MNNTIQNKQKCFDFRRLALLQKQEYITLRHNYTMLLVGFIITFVYLSFPMFYDFFYGRDYDGNIGESGIHFIRTIFIVAPIIFICQQFQLMSKKNYFLNMTMLPASILEKFLNKLIYGMIVIPIMLVIIFIAAAGLKTLVASLLFPENGIHFIINDTFWDQLFFYRNTSGLLDLFDDNGTLVVFISLLWNLYLLSCFVVGGNYFKKQSFLKTTGMFLLTWTTFFSLVFYIAYLNHDRIGNYLSSFEREEIAKAEGIIQIAIPSILALLTCLNFYWGYWLFRNKQLTKCR